MADKFGIVQRNISKYVAREQFCGWNSDCNHRVPIATMHSSVLARRVRLLVVFGFVTAAGFAQSDTEGLAIAPADTPQSGTVVGRHGKFELYNVTTSVGYSSLGNFGTSSSALGTLGADYDITSAVSAGYSSTGEGGYFSLIYTPSYTRRIRFSNLSAFDQSLALSLRHNLTGRSTLKTSLDISDATVQQLAFVPSTFANAAAANGTSGDVLRGIVGQSPASVQVDEAFAQRDTGNAAILAGLFGSRVLTGAAHLEYDWAATARSQLFVATDASRDQPLEANTELGQQSQSTLRSSAESVSAGWNHSVSPRTTTGFAVGYHRSRSGYFNGDVTDANYTVGQEFRNRWFTTASAGLGRVSIGPQTSGAPVRTSLQWLSSGSVGVKGHGQSVIFHAARSGGDSYGLGSDSSTSAGLSWNWTPSRHAYSLFVDNSYQRLREGGTSNVAAWTLGGGAEKRITRQATASLSLAYLDSSGQTLISGQPRISGYQIQLTIAWSPRPVVN